MKILTPETPAVAQIKTSAANIQLKEQASKPSSVINY
jgi:hypothetical protein